MLSTSMKVRQSSERRKRQRPKARRSDSRRLARGQFRFCSSSSLRPLPAAPDTFATTVNFRVIVAGQATIVLLALALVIPLRAGDFDLSVAAVMILVGCMVGSLSEDGHSTAVACGFALLIGPIVGFINGLLVVRVGIDSFIATLGTFTVLVGLSRFVSGGTFVTTVPQDLIELCRRSVFNLSLSVWVGWFLALAVWYVFECTPVGRYLLFIGSSISAAKLAGLVSTPTARACTSFPAPSARSPASCSRAQFARWIRQPAVRTCSRRSPLRSLGHQPSSSAGSTLPERSLPSTWSL